MNVTLSINTLSVGHFSVDKNLIELNRHWNNEISLWEYFATFSMSFEVYRGSLLHNQLTTRLCETPNTELEMFKKNFETHQKIQKFEVGSVFDSWFIIPTSRTSNIKNTENRILKKFQKWKFFSRRFVNNKIQHSQKNISFYCCVSNIYHLKSSPTERDI